MIPDMGCSAALPKADFAAGRTRKPIRSSRVHPDTGGQRHGCVLHARVPLRPVGFRLAFLGHMYSHCQPRGSYLRCGTVRGDADRRFEIQTVTPVKAIRFPREVREDVYSWSTEISDMFRPRVSFHARVQRACAGARHDQEGLWLFL